MAELKDSGARRDLINKKFEMLTILSEIPERKSGHIVVNCVCECGTYKEVILSDLLKGKIKSCGCYRRKIVTSKNTKHGMSKTRIYSIWCDMHKRCENSKNKRFENYGARGIAVCKEWDCFEPFYIWALDNGYSENLSIDRIDVNKGYSPSNCRWSTAIEQQNNTTRNKYIEFSGKMLTQAQWSRITGISQSVIKDRLTKLNWGIEKALTTPVGRV